MNPTRIAALATLGAVPVAGAQVDGTATWLWDVTTENGDAVVEPGETATITLSLDMDPNPNYPGGPVLGFGVTLFDTLGGTNARNGHIVGWEILNQLDLLGGDPTTTDGVSLFGSNPGQSPLGPWTPEDPIDVLAFTWSPDVLSQYEVNYATLTEALAVVQGTGHDDFFYVDWMRVTEAEIAFVVIPSPMGAVPLIISFFALSVVRK